MKIRIMRHCKEMIDGNLTILDSNSVKDVEEDDAARLFEKGIAEEITCSEDGQVIQCENKMISLTRKRGRPRKEV
jgi:hypothetical protein